MLETQDINLLKRVLTFWDRIPEQQAQLIASTTVVRYRQGDSLHNADSECLGVVIVKSGELRTYIMSEDGKEVTLYRMGPSEVCILSASCLLKNITFDVHIDAVRDTEILVIGSALFSKLQENNVYVENFSLRLTADRFSDVMWAMEQILFMSLDRRLAVFLLDECAKIGSDTIELTHDQIARYIGSAREAVSRMLKYFAGEGMVELHRGGVKLVNKTALNNITLY